MSFIETSKWIAGAGGVTRRQSRLVFGGIALAGLTVWAASGTEFNLVKLISGVPEIIALLKRMLPPNFTVVGGLMWPMVETMEMALLGTTLPIVFAFPLSFLAADNTSPHRIVLGFTRVFAAFLRTVPDLVWGMILVSAVGLGPMPGVLALTLHAIGGLTKMFYEAIENVPKGSVEALDALGANRLRIILFVIIPGVMPAMISNVLLYWEYNNRSAAVLGLVGAGGIGLALTQALADFRYRDVSMCLLVIVVVLVVIDLLSASLRKRVI